MCAERSADRPLETLFLPLLEGHLAWPEGGALFLRARAGAPLRARSWPGLVCQQSFAPDAAALERLQLRVLTDDLDASTQTYPLVLVLPPRQRDEARALLARAVRSTQPGGRIVACASNDEGARSGQADLERIAGPVTTLTKNKCRVFWSAPLDGPYEAVLADEWLQLDAAQPIARGPVRQPARRVRLGSDRRGLAAARRSSAAGSGRSRGRPRRWLRLPVRRAARTMRRNHDARCV